MSETVIDALVMDGEDENPGTAAVFHGMLATMAEVLERLDERLSTLEATIVGQTTATRTATQRMAAELPEAISTAVAEAVSRGGAPTALARLDARLADIEAAVSRPDTSALEARLDAVAAAVDAAVDAAVEAAVDAPVAALTSRFDALAAALETSAGRPVAALAERLDGLATTVEAAVEAAAGSTADALTCRLDALAGAVAASQVAPGALAAEVRTAVDGALAEARTDTGERMKRLADVLAALAQPPAPPDLGALLDDRLAAVTAGIADLLTRAGATTPDDSEATRALARSLARLEADVAEARAETAMGVQSVAGRIEEAVAAARGRDEEVLRRTVEAVEALVANAGRIEAAVGEGRGEADRKGKASRAEIETVGRLADRIADLQEAVNRSRGETTTAVERLAAELSQRAATPTVVEGTLDEVADRLARVEAVVTATRQDGEARATALASDVQTALGAGLERLLTHATGNGDLVAADVRAALGRLAEVAAGVESMSTTLAGVSEQVARLAADDRTRPVLAAIETASHDQQEAVAALQAAVVRRIDGRTSALARALEGVGDLGPLLQRLDAAVDQDDARAKSLERLLTDLRDDLAKEVGGLTKRQVGSLRLLERVSAALDDEQRRLEGVQSLCQSVAAAVEQQAAVGSRMAELVLETRSAMRSDVERLESTVQLDNAKRQQHDHARLAQMAAGVSEVVERETALVGQRVAALASTVESLRNAFHLNGDDLQPSST
ncbi:MAG: hypothetical protein KY443_07345 [Actinobacteria bacterium]|nr:hypothetical protein [Actinomycetota bacterium]